MSCGLLHSECADRLAVHRIAAVAVIELSDTLNAVSEVTIRLVMRLRQLNAVYDSWLAAVACFIVVLACTCNRVYKSQRKRAMFRVI